MNNRIHQFRMDAARLFYRKSTDEPVPFPSMVGIVRDGKGLCTCEDKEEQEVEVTKKEEEMIKKVVKTLMVVGSLKNVLHIVEKEVSHKLFHMNVGLKYWKLVDFLFFRKSTDMEAVSLYRMCEGYCKMDI